MRKLLIFNIAILLLLSVGCSLNRPEISEQALTGSSQIIEAYDEIEEANVFIEEGKIRFYLIPKDEGVSKERIRELGSDFLKVLSGYTVTEDIQGPDNESYGEIYVYYDAEIVVEGYKEILDRGFKAKKDTEIQWEE